MNNLNTTKLVMAKWLPYYNPTSKALLYQCLFGDIPNIKNKKRKHCFKLECAGSGKLMGLKKK